MPTVARLALTAALCVATSTAWAESPLYITGSLGALQPMDLSRSTTFGNALGQTGPGTNTTTFNAGPAVTLGLGYRLPWGFRVEGELGYAHYMTDSASPLSTNGAFPALNGTRLPRTSGGSHELFTATLDGFYDLPVPGRFVPYVGGGFGYYHAVGEDTTFGHVFRQRGETGDNVVVLGEVGLTMKLDAHWSVVPAYRFEHLFAADHGDANASLFKLGMRYAF